MKYINKNALIAMKRKGFCPASKKAFSVSVSNTLRIADSDINSVSDSILFLAKVAVMAATAAVRFMWLKSNADLHYYAIHVILVCVHLLYCTQLPVCF